MKQTRLGSLYEALFNTAVGYLAVALLQFVIAAVFEVEVDLATLWPLALAITAISIVRNYAVRRFFNRSLGREALALKAQNEALRELCVGYALLAGEVSHGLAVDDHLWEDIIRLGKQFDDAMREPPNPGSNMKQMRPMRKSDAPAPV